MANLHLASNPVSPQGPLGSSAGATIALNSQWRREKDIYPIVNATTGPLTADSGVVSGDLSTTTGLRFIPWTAVDQVTGQPVFNYQGMVPTNAPANIITAAGRTPMLNAFTPRWFNGSTGQYYNGVQSIRVGIASARVVFVWYTAQAQISATNVDMHVMVEHGGSNKHLSSSSSVADGLPTVGGGGSGTYRRDLTYVDSRYREHRLILGPNSYFLGVWIDTMSVIRRPKNRPQMFVHGVDSWQDPQTVVGNGTGFTGRDYQCLPQAIVSSFHTGMCHGIDGQGGTGEYNANGTSGGDVATYSGNRSSAAWSDSRVNWRANWYSSQYPIFADIGGWNDGTSMTSPYQSTYLARVSARVQKTITACQNKGYDCRFVNVGIQGVQITGSVAAGAASDPTYMKYLASLGQLQLPSSFPGVVLGAVSLMDMWWWDTTSSGPRSIYCNSTDGIHLLAIGDDAVANWYWERIGEFNIDTAFVAKTVAADVPIVSVPTS
jgi:hypothetical protein